MVEVNQYELTYNGVALSNMNIDELRLFESKTIEKIIENDNTRIKAKTESNTLLERYQVFFIDLLEQIKGKIEAEINKRYEGFRV